MKKFNPYTLALLLNEGQFSCAKAAKKLPGISHDKLTRLVNKAFDDGIVTDFKHLPEGGTVITDDTVIAKPHAKAIEGTLWVYDSSQNKPVNGLNVLLVLYVHEEDIYLLDMLRWEKGGQGKNAWFRDVLTRFKIHGPEPAGVLFDGWFASQETLNLIHRLQWRYTSRCKSNRLFKGQAVSQHRFWGNHGKRGRLKGVNHPVQLVKHGKRFLVTNTLTSHTSRSLAAVYARRWCIEEVFRALKTVLHLGKCACRGVHAQMNHVGYCLDAYFFLRQAYPHLGPEHAQQEFLKDFNASKPFPPLNYPLAA